VHSSEVVNSTQFCSIVLKEDVLKVSIGEDGSYTLIAYTHTYTHIHAYVHTCVVYRQLSYFRSTIPNHACCCVSLIHLYVASHTLILSYTHTNALTKLIYTYAHILVYSYAFIFMYACITYIQFLMYSCTYLHIYSYAHELVSAIMYYHFNHEVLFPLFERVVRRENLLNGLFHIIVMRSDR